MALIVCEGLDRVGKTSVADWYADQGYEIIHMSAPPRGQSSDDFLQTMSEIVLSAAHKDVFLDRSYWGEYAVWPQVYGRQSLLDEENLSILMELEESVGTTRIFMHDPNVEAHWKRCVDNNEPLTKAQFIKARALYAAMADKYGFTKKTLNDFPEALQLAAQVAQQKKDDHNGAENSQHVSNKGVSSTNSSAAVRTPQQLKLDKANAINEVLAKRIIKGKGPVFDDLERSVRGFLNGELGKIFGSQPTDKNVFSNEEVELLKFFCQRLKNKENN